MSSSKLLTQLNDELVALLEMSVPRTCTIFPMQMHVRTGHGSGWFYSPDLVVTNHHVVADAMGEVVVRGAGNNAEIRAKVLGSDSFSDLAVLHIPNLNAEPFIVRDEPARVGEICLAIGTPIDISLQNSASFGIVGGVGRQVVFPHVKFEEAIQTDAIINGGNSGGPLIDIDGLVIGVNSWSRLAQDSTNSGLGFAIPSEIIRDVVPEIVAHGSVKRASIGVSVTARRHKKDHGFETVITITKTNLDDSLLKPGDIISTVNGTPIGRRYDLIRLLNRSLVGTVVEIEVIRSGQPIKINTEAVAK